MSISNFSNIANLAVITMLSIFAFMLLEISAQFVLPATYEARLINLRASEAAHIKAEAERWRREGRPVDIQVGWADGDRPSGRVNLTVSMNLTELELETLSAFLANIESDFSGHPLTLSREPSPLGRSFATLGAVLLFLVLFKKHLGSDTKKYRAQC